MSVLKLTKNDITRNDDKEEKIKLKRSDLSYDSARVSGWEQANRQSLDILNDYNNRINKSEWLTKEDRENYRKALDSYIETSNYLRGINKTFGEGYTDEDEKNWNDSISSMNKGYDEISNFYSQFASDKVYSDWQNELKADEAYKANFSSIDINKASEGWQKYLAEEGKAKADAPSAWQEMILRGFATSSDNLFNQTYNNIVYDYRNDTSYARPNDSWTEDEKNVFGQLYLESPAKAYAFAEERNNRTNKKAEEDKIKAIQDFATQNGWAMAGTTLASIAAAPMAWADLFNNFAKMSAGRDVVDDGYVTPGEFSEAVQSGIGAHLNEYGTLDEDLWAVGGKGLGDLYGLGTSIAQSMLYGKVGKAVGSKYLPLINYFGQGAASSMSEGLEIGLSDEGAVLYGIAMGAFEAIPELIGIDNFFKIGSSSTFKGFLKTVGSQAGSEFLEEGITSVLSNGADAVVAALADKGRIAYAIAAYKNEGLSDSEAKKRVIHDILGEVLYDSVAGGISGGISGGIESLGQTVLANADAKARYGDQVEGILVDAGTNKNLSKSDGKYVDKYIDKYGKNGQLSGWNINHLLEMTDNSKVKSAVEAQLTKLGESGDVSQLADIITKQVQGIELSKKEQSILDNSTYGQRVINGLDPKKIKSGKYDTAWAETIGTRRLNAKEYNNPQLIYENQIKKLMEEQEANPDALENTPTNVNVTEGENSKVTIEKDGEKVEVKPTKITSIENDTMSVELDNGEVVNADEVDFGDSGIGLVYQAAKDMASRVGGFNIDTANVFVRGYDPNGNISAGEYVHGWRAAFKFGAMNSPISALEGDVYTSKLTDKQRKDAYNFGKTFGNDSVVENANNASQSGKTKKQGKVHFDGLKHGKNLNERQRASLKGLQFIAKSLGIDIYVFESPKNAEGGRMGENGWYDPSDHSIHIDLYAGAEAEALMLFTASHELTHHIREVLPEKFNILADAVYEEYTKAYGKANFERLIDNKTDFLKEKGRITEDMSEEQAYDLAYEEVIADCFETMLVDSNAIEALSKNVYAKDKGLWEKIKDFIAKLVARITGAYKDVRPDSEEGNMFRALGSAAERLQNLWVDAIVEASGITNSMPENTVAVIKDGQFYKIRGEAAVRMSKELELTLSHETIDGKKVPMVGFPLRYFDTYNKKAAKKGFSLKDTGEVKYSYSSIAYSFFGDKKISIKDLENGSYKDTDGYKRYVDQCLNNMRQSVEGFSEKSALKEITDSIDGIVEVAVAMKKAGYDILDSEGGRNIRDSKKRLLFSSLEPNSDYFTSSDISTICDKRINFAEIYDEIVRREDAMGVPKNKRFFNNIDNYFVLHKILAEKGLTAPCRQCYVESMRKNLDPMANAFIELMQETDPNNKDNKQLYQPSGKNKGEIKSNNAKLRENLLEVIEREQYDITADKLTIKMLTTADGLAQLKLQAPLIYEAFNSFYGQSKPKMPKAATPFRFGELTALLTDDKGKIKTGLIKQIMSTGGFRLQSYSDFQIQNFADVLQVIFEAGTLGLNGHAYTKVPAFLDATKGTNLKRNISIFMYKDGGQWKIDRGDSFPYELEDIYDIVDADESGNTGIIAVVQNEDMAAWIMANNNIGYFIPFHKSGVKMGVVRDTVVREGGREIKGYSGIKDHTRQQTEVWAKTTADHKANTKVKKGINIYEFWDFDNAKNLSQKELIRKNVMAYIDACNEAGYLPKFREYVMDNGKVLNKVLAYAKELGFVSQNATIDDISFEYSGYRIPYGYYKCLGDFGMFTPDGEASPIERLSLKDYNFKDAVKFFSDAETLRRNEILQQFENGTEREKYRSGEYSYMTTAELSEEVQNRRNQVVDEVVSGEYKKKKYEDRASAKSDFGANDTQPKITADMTEEERYEVLKKRSINNIPLSTEISSDVLDKIPEISSWDDISKYFGKNKKTLIKKLAKEFKVFGKEYVNDDIKLAFEFSGQNFSESYKKQGKNYIEFAKIFSVFDPVIESAVGVEIHNRTDYKPDPTLDNVFVLMSAYQDGEYLIPVKLEVKQFKDKQNTLYVAISLEKIKMAELNARGDTENGVTQRTRSTNLTEVSGQGNTENGVTQSPRSVNISIAQIFAKINPSDKNFLKYIPDGFLDDKQKAAKQEALVEDADNAYMSAIKRNDMQAAQRMVDEAAKKAGYDSPKLYHGTPLKMMSASKSKLTASEYAELDEKYDDKLFPFVVFKAEKSRSGLTYTATSRKAAETFAYPRPGTVFGLYGKFVNPLVVNEHIYQSVPYYYEVPTPSVMKKAGISKSVLSTEEIAHWAKTHGYDGVIVEGVREGGGDYTDDYIVFSSSQLKSADPVTYDDNGDVIPLSERFNTKNSDIRYSDRPTKKASYAPAFYSHMGKVIDGIKLEKMGAGGVVSYLKGRGVKDEEIKWSGIETFLEGKKSVTKAELQEFVAGSQLQIEETNSGINNEAYTELDNLWREHFLSPLEDVFDPEDFDETTVSAQLAFLDENGMEMPSEDIQQRMIVLAHKIGKPTRWEQYKLDGGENYREIVFKMPDSTYSNRAMRGHWGQDAEGILVHARIQDFTVDGKKMLFIEELQSDWHNEGLQKGYTTPEYEDAVAVYDKLADEYGKVRQAFNKYVRSSEFRSDPDEVSKKKFDWLRSKMDIAEQRMQDAERDVEKFKEKGMGDVADAPFRENYHEYVLKRLLRMAAEEGYDSIGWTPSEIQSDRWSDEYAEAYRIEYDQEMPKFLRKYGKRWGATVGKSEIEVAEHSINGEHYDAENIEVWSMDITDSMKESVLTEGQPLYQDRSDYSFSHRSLLANALETTAQNEIEKEKLKQYKEKINLINAEEQKLHELREKIKELSFAKGPRDTEAINKLQFEANQAANRVNTYDKQLLNLESTKALKGVIEREKEMLRKRLEQKATQSRREALDRARERAAKTERELMNRYQESRKRATESRNKTAMRYKIKGIVSELNTLLLRPTAKKHIKEELRKEVADALLAINMDTVGADERVAMYNDLIAKENNPDIIAELTKTRDNIQLQGDNLKEKLNNLQSAYEKIKNTDDIELNLAYQEVIQNSIKAVSEKVGKTSIRNMTLEQLEMVYDLFKMIRHTIRDANKAFKTKKGETIMQMAEAVNDQVRTVGGQPYKHNVISATLQRIGWTFLKPYVAFRTIGSITLTNMYKELRNGEDTFYTDVKEAQAFIEDQYKKHGYKSWDMKKTKTFTAKSGKTFDLTLEQMMSLYAYYQREQAHDHIIEGGIVFEDSLVTEKNKWGIPIKYEVTTKDAFNLSEDTFKGICDYLEENHKDVVAYVKEMQAYLSDTMGTKGNEVSMELLGVKLFKEKFYLPIKSSQYYMNFKAEEAGEVKLKSPAFSKETVKHANNPIVIHNFTDLWAEHINDMSMYHAFVLALEDFTRVYNYKTKTDAKVETMDTKATLETAYPGVTNYINKFLRDMNGGVRSETVGWAENLTSLSKKGAVLGSASVTVQQPSAVMRAMAYINPKYFVATAHKSINLAKHKQDFDELKKYAPIAGIKEMGRFDVGMGQGTVDWIKSNKTVMDKAEDILSLPPAFMDEVTWVSIWNAVKRETAHNNPTLNTGSEEFLKLAGERFTEIISLSQVYDSVFSRSDLMRNKSWIAKSLTAFMAEPTTVLNMIWDSWVQAKRTGSVKGYVTATTVTGGAVVAATVLNAALKSIILAMRDDDEDESYAEKYLEAFVGDLKDSLNPLSLVPFVKDIVSIFKGYDVERMDMAMFSDLKKALDAMDSDSKTLYEKWSGLMGAISAFAGVPFKNVERDIRGLITTVFGKTEETTIEGMLNAIKEGWTGKESSNGQQLYEAMIKGDSAQIKRVEGRFEDQNDIDAAIRKALRENDPRIRKAAEAYLNRDYATYNKLREEIAAEGIFSRVLVTDALKAEYNYLKKKAEEAE